MVQRTHLPIARNLNSTFSAKAVKSTQMNHVTTSKLQKFHITNQTKRIPELMQIGL